MKYLSSAIRGLAVPAAAALAVLSTTVCGQAIRTNITFKEKAIVFSLDNEKIGFKVVFTDHILSGDTLSGMPEWLDSFGSPPFCIATDAGFGLDFVWTDWQGPHAGGNAENPVRLDNKDFILEKGDFTNLPDGSTELVLDFKAADAPWVPVLLRITYHMDPGTFYVRRKIAVRDTVFGKHFLDRIHARSGEVAAFTGISRTIAEPRILKNGGFGQPVALLFEGTGCFFGLEYPAATNTLTSCVNRKALLDCFQEFGQKVDKDPVESEWVVEALIPAMNVKDWFFRYLDQVRVAPARPYVLYNSWYDLRSPEYPKVEAGHVMNEKNVYDIIRLFRKNMIEKHRIGLDAFVLDDGWDVYESDWALRKETFPNGLKPISDTLETMGTGLGIWFGPTGGYSFRMKRVNWMGSHGYETVGVNRDNKMLCLAGKNYSELFRKRVVDLTAEGVSYFKWDGIQFSCSEPDHGHPVGLYSRRAVMESVIGMCRAVRQVNPKTYLNITSGTWLSPWWVKYANQIWMQGADYGYSDVPSFSQRDAAITYKDFVLYDDFTRKDLWFPLSNLMTHGIIKGNLERLGGEDDPLNKFTDDAVFYVARGVSMIELYVSPDLLTDGEWDAIGSAISWAKDRWDVLSNTYMTGGDVQKGETYGFVHFKGNRGIIAVRNPRIEPSEISIALDECYGLDPDASNLVLEKVYPCRWISPRLYSAAEAFTLPVEGFETAVYEIYPVTEAAEPLLSGARFEVDKREGSQYSLTVFEAPAGTKLLNPERVKESGYGLPGNQAPKNPLVSQVTPELRMTATGPEIVQRIEADPSVREVRFALLLQPGPDYAEKDLPGIALYMDGTEIKPFVVSEKGKWAWISAVTGPGTGEIRVSFARPDTSAGWNGTASLYLICQQKTEGRKVVFTTNTPLPSRPMPPSPFEPGVTEKTVELGKVLMNW